jgi:hypothetical protein
MITDPHACKAHSGLRESRHDARRGSGLPGDIGQRGPWDPPGVTAPLVGMGDRAGSTLRLLGCHSPSPQWNHHPEQSRVVARRHCRNRPSGTVRTPRDGGDHARRFPICTSPPVRLLPLPARSPGPLDPGRPRSCAAPTEVGSTACFCVVHDDHPDRCPCATAVPGAIVLDRLLSAGGGIIGRDEVLDLVDGLDHGTGEPPGRQAPDS